DVQDPRRSAEAEESKVASGCCATLVPGFHGLASAGPFYFWAAKYSPVQDRLHCATSSRVPTTTPSPPRFPPSGPRSITQSAALITSRLCSITSSDPPASINRLNDAINF